MEKTTRQADQLAVDSLRRALRSLLVLRYAMACCAAWAFAWGAGVLLLRTAAVLPRQSLAWGALGFAPALALGWRMALRRLPGEGRLRAAIDRRSFSGGLVMSVQEAEIGGWSGSLDRLRPVPARWRSGRFAGMAVAAAAFVGVAFLVPDSMVQAGPDRGLNVARETEKLKEQIEVLREERILDARKADELEKRLDQIREEAKGRDPARTWEALDHVERANKAEAAEAAEARAAEAQKLASAETLAEALADAAGEMRPEDLAEAMGALSDLMADAAEESALASKGLPESMLNAAKKGTLTADELRELSKLLKGGRGDLAEGLEKLCEAGLIDAESLEKLKGMCEGGACDAEALAAFLAEGEGDCSGEGLRAMLAGSRPGRGGINRGRGDAQISFGEETPDAGARFEAVTLPPGSIQGLRDSGLAGVSVAEPETGDGEAIRSPGALGGAAAGGGAAETGRILPRHRGTVRRYFERE